LIPSVDLSTKIVRVLGGEPPETFTYELFLDEQGQKISKSKGNGLSVDEWLAYGPEESLALFMFQKPHAAKRLYFDAIPKAVDDYLAFVAQYHRDGNESAAAVENPVWFVHSGEPRDENYPVSFALLLNLVSASGASERDVLWGFIRAYAPDAQPLTHPGLDRLVTYALKYYEDFVRPQKRYRAASEKEREALSALADALENMAEERNGEAVQNVVYEIGKSHGFDPLRDWFKAIYEVALGQTQGPRFGSFAALFGCAQAAVLIRTALSGAFLVGGKG
jgi:lysyl-tRNA synthetase class 1